MIARLWHGRVPAEKADAYAEYLSRTGIPDYMNTEGNRGVYVMRRKEGEFVHFLLLSLWNDYDAIVAFAGDDYEEARYYPEDRDFLVELEPAVIHYEVTGAWGE
jgi:heme-degrading monooxygenase HmoA